MFAILLRKLKDRPRGRQIQANISDNDDDDDQSRLLIESQSIIELNSFQVRLTQKEPPKIPSNWLTDKLNRLNFEALGSDDIQFESNENFAQTVEYFDEFFGSLDTYNTNKAMVYLVERLAESVLSTHDELNCVEIVEIVNELILKLIDSSQFDLAAYLILEIGKRIDSEIDLIEASRVRGELWAFTNEKLTGNCFFMSELLTRRVCRLVEITERLASTVSGDDEMEWIVMGSVISRVFYLITKLVVRKLTRFDALVDLEFDLECLFKTCFQIGVQPVKVSTIT